MVALEKYEIAEINIPVNHATQGYYYALDFLYEDLTGTSDARWWWWNEFRESSETYFWR